MSQNSGQHSHYPVTHHNNQEFVDAVDQLIDKALISRRSGGGSTSLAFVKGDILSDALNAVVGPLGWGKESKIHSVEHFEDARNVKRDNVWKDVQMNVVVVISTVTLTIKKLTPDGTDTVFVEQGTGYGETDAGKSRKDAYTMAVKGASTDGMKRCVNHLGKRFGMMMASSGIQDDLEYAHGGKAADVQKARRLRNDTRGGGTKMLEDHSGRDDRDDRGRDGGDRGGGARDDRGRQHDDGRDRVRSNGARDDQRGARGSDDARGRDDQRGGGAARDRDRDDRSNGQRDRSDERRGDDGKGADGERKPGGDAARPSGDRDQSGGGDAGGAADRGAADRGAAGRPETTGDDRPAGGTRGAARTPNTNYKLDNIPVSRTEQTDFAATLAAQVKDMRQRKDREGLVRQHLNTVRNLDAVILKRLRTLLGESDVDIDRL